MFKVAFMGGAACGKTQLINGLTALPEVKFEEKYQPSINPDVHGKDINGSRFLLWDFPGSEKYQGMSKVFMKDSHVGVFCVDLSQPIDQEQLKKAIAVFKELNPKAKLILAGTKYDACPDKETAEKAKDTFNNLNVDDIEDRFLTSAKNKTDFTPLENCLYTLTRETKQKSSLSAEQLVEINKLICSLKKELNSCWPYPNQDRKRIKILALNALITHAETKTISKAIEAMNALYPEEIVRAGSIHTRTSDLLTKLNPAEHSTPTPY